MAAGRDVLRARERPSHPVARSARAEPAARGTTVPVPPRDLAPAPRCGRDHAHAPGDDPPAHPVAAAADGRPRFPDQPRRHRPAHRRGPRRAHPVGRSQDCGGDPHRPGRPRADHPGVPLRRPSEPDGLESRLRDGAARARQGLGARLCVRPPSLPLCAVDGWVRSRRLAPLQVCARAYRRHALSFSTPASLTRPLEARPRPPDGSCAHRAYSHPPPIDDPGPIGRMCRMRHVVHDTIPE